MNEALVNAVDGKVDYKISCFGTLEKKYNVLLIFTVGFITSLTAYFIYKDILLAISSGSAISLTIMANYKQVSYIGIDNESIYIKPIKKDTIIKLPISLLENSSVKRSSKTRYDIALRFNNINQSLMISRKNTKAFPNQISDVDDILRIIKTTL